MWSRFAIDQMAADDLDRACAEVDGRTANELKVRRLGVARRTRRLGSPGLITALVGIACLATVVPMSN